VLVDVHGFFGARMAEMAARFGAKVTAVEGEWGRPADLAKLRAAARGKQHALVCTVHAETSTGVVQDLAPVAELARELGALFVVDAVTSLGCQAIDADAQGIDAVYSCSQKGLSCPPGLAPVSFSERAAAKLRARKSRPFWYLDVELLMSYWSGPRAYHHTASSNLYYALHEGCRVALAEGLEARFARHRRIGDALRRGIAELGLEPLVRDGDHLPQLCAVKVPNGVDDAAVRTRLLRQYGIEIGGGLGPLKGKLWRIGLMGAGASERNVVLVLAALRSALQA
jgi:alanine-glyoxylate transaminase/serine-glyoxylate transaminase/serine-pyruvate transaminase